MYRSYSNIKLLFHGRKTLWTVIRLRRLRIIMFEKLLSDAHADDKCELFLYIKLVKADFLMCKVVQVQINLLSMRL